MDNKLFSSPFANKEDLWKEGLDNVLKRYLSFPENKIIETDFAYNVVFNNPRALDIVNVENDERYLIYLSTESDKTSYDMLRTSKIPLLGDRQETYGLTVIRIPLHTKGLGSIVYPEQYFTGQRYLGALEIMRELGKYIGQIYNRTKHVPKTLDLKKFAIVGGETGLIRMVPPYELSSDFNELNFVSSLAQSLKECDPVNSDKHDIHVQVFYRSLKDVINKDVKSE
ncbi:MAG: hypothetical protein KatS3mg083_586 [Candidatus Dojkabacteria bacterium]|nr:MAG: hypothetical protein KatS3mg083_586 [Candidatus Dojkabacteria bacterium]